MVTADASGTANAVGATIKITFKTQPPLTFRRSWAGMTIEQALTAVEYDKKMPPWIIPVQLYRGETRRGVELDSRVVLIGGDRLILTDP